MAEQDIDQDIMQKKVRNACAIALLVFTPISLFITIWSAAAEYNPTFIYLLYPLPALMFEWRMFILGLIIAVVQFPALAVACLTIRTKKTFCVTICTFIAAHTVLAIYAFILF